MRRAIVTLFQLLLFVVPFAFASVNDELFEFNKMMAVYAFSILIGLAWGWRMLEEKRVIFHKTILVFPLLFFVLSQALSTVFSMHPNTSIFGYYSRFHGGLLSTISYTFLYFAAVSNLTKKDLPKLMFSAFAAAVGVALYAIPEHFGVSPSCILITGEFTASCWIQDVQTRVFATFGQPNWLAAYFLLLIPLTVWLHTFLQERKAALWKTWLPLGALALFITALLYTRSRSGFLALAGELALMLTGIGIWQVRQKSGNKKSSTFAFPKLLAFPAVMVALIFLIGSPYTPSASEILSRLNPSTSAPVTEAPTESSAVEPTPPSGTSLETLGTDSSKIREIVWKGALAVWRRYPLLGSGVETFAYSYYQDRPMEHNLNSEWDFLYNRAHNEYLNALATTGLLGLSALLLLQGTIGVMLARTMIKAWHNNNRSHFWLATGLGIGFAGAAVTNFFGFSTVMVGVLMFLFPAFLLIAESPDQAPATLAHPGVKAKLRRHGDELELNIDGNWLAGGTLGLLALFLLMSVFTMWNNDRLLAQAKATVSEGQALEAYRILESLTQRAPHEAVFWNEKSLVMAQIAAAAAKEDASIAAGLSKQAIQASDTAVKLNPVQLNHWKSRVRVFLLLSLFDESKLVNALETLQSAQKLAPTDAKLVYNEALVYDSIGKTSEADVAFQRAIDMRPIYEEARQNYAKFLERNNQYEAALEQYTYVLNNLNPGDTTTREHVEALSASISAKRL